MSPAPPKPSLLKLKSPPAFNKALLIDKLLFQILMELQESGGLRYVGLKAATGSSDSTLTWRLRIAIEAKLIVTVARCPPNRRNYFEYVLTHEGKAFIQRHDLMGFFEP
jgi:DNA-binding HxlR family transcriptional regulator